MIEIRRSRPKRVLPAGEKGRLRLNRPFHAPLLFVFCSPIVLASAALAQGVRPGSDEIQVNDYTTGSQWRPVVASLGNGRFVVAWESDGFPDDDSPEASVQGRCFDGDGSPSGPEFQVNSHTADNLGDTAIAPLADGGAVLAWMSYSSSGTDSSEFSIQTRRLTADCSPVGEDFQVNTYTYGYQSSPAVATLAGGDFVIVWGSPGSYGSDTHGGSIQGRRFDSDGRPLGGDFQINSYTYGEQEEPAIAPLEDGGFVVVWDSLGSGSTDVHSFSIQGRRFDPDGLPKADDFQVNTYTTGVQVHAAVAGLADGGFVVAWNSEGPNDPDNFDKTNRGQRFGADGSPQGDEFQLNSNTTDDQLLPVLTALTTGGFVAAWHSRASDGTDLSGWSIQARRFTADGAPLGEDLQVNDYTEGWQLRPAIADLTGGEIAVAWVSEGSVGSRVSFTAVPPVFYARITCPGRFCPAISRRKGRAPGVAFELQAGDSCRQDRGAEPRSRASAAGRSADRVSIGLSRRLRTRD